MVVVVVVVNADKIVVAECCACGAVGRCTRYAPREDEIRDSETVPPTVIQPPVAATAVVNEYHDAE
jgi:hypothetical protein